MTEAAPASEVAPYLEMIRAYDKAADKWRGAAKKIVKRYLDERPEGQVTRLKFNILWANVETLKPAIYAKTPKPEVERRYLDKDPVGRAASEVLERCLDYYISATPFGSTMRQARMDYLLVGRGVAWVRYVPKLVPLESPASPQLTDDAAAGDHGDDGDDPAPAEQLAWEDVLSDYVHWRDFGHNVARTWEEVECVWRIVYMTRRQMKRRGFREWNDIPLDYADKDHKDAPDAARKAAVYELWDKAKRKAFWLTKAHPRFLDERDDPLELDRFFPCSEPVYATLANDSLIPVPDYAEYQDQAVELDELTARIAALQKAIKAAGVYDASQPALGRLLSEGVTNELIPVESWATLKDKGGLAGAVELLPMKEIAETLLMLYDAREKVKQDLYEITGMADIIRGATKASETATAQNIKNNYVTLRLSEKQREMQRFARNTIEIMGNIICRHFSLETIRKVSGVQLLTLAEKRQVGTRQQQALQMAQITGGRAPPPPLPDELRDMLAEPSWDEVFALLRDQPERGFRIEIETDSTIEMDAGQERDEAMAFLQAVGGFIKACEGVPPALAPLAGAMLEFGVRKWRVGRTLEATINKTVEMLEKQAANPPPPQPDPAMAKVQGEQQLAAFTAQAEQSREAARLQGEQQLEAIRIQADQASAAAKADAQARQAAMEAMFEANMTRWKALLDARTKIEVAEIAAGATLDAAQVAAANGGAG